MDDSHGKVNALTAQVIKLFLTICDSREEAEHVLLHVAEWMLKSRMECLPDSFPVVSREDRIKSILNQGRN